MQSDHRVPYKMPILQRSHSYRKRNLSNGNPRKRDRSDLICVVCHAPAMGYNFDQITCESCKAFFRRNALNNNGKFKCRSGTNDCLITLETRKRCKACRLKKCFDKGLRKEWIMSEEEKRTKKQKIEDNRRLRALSQTLGLSSIRSFTPSSSPSMVPENENYFFPIEYSTNLIEDDFNCFDATPEETLHEEPLNKSSLNHTFDFESLFSIDEAVQLKKIEENFIQAIRLNISVIKGCERPCLRNLHQLTDLINELGQMSALRMITFLKLTPEFHSLHEDDRLALVKEHLMAIFYLHLSIGTDLDKDLYQEPHAINDFCYPASILRLFSSSIADQARDFIDELQSLISMDHLIVQLLILIVIFSHESNRYETHEWHDAEQIFQGQNHYIQLLWNYLSVRYSSEQAIAIYSRLIFSCMKAQDLGRQTKALVTEQIPSYEHDHLAPLMQSILFLS